MKEINKCVRVVFILVFVLSDVHGVDVDPKNDIERGLLSLLNLWRSGDATALPIPVFPLDVIEIPPLFGYYEGKGANDLSHHDLYSERKDPENCMHFKNKIKDVYSGSLRNGNRLDIHHLVPKITYSSGEIFVRGVDNFTIAELNAIEANMETSGIITFREIKITSDNYELDGRALLIYPLRGSGTMEVDIQDITLVFTIRLGPSSSGIGTTVIDFQYDYDVGKILVNLVDSSWPINKVLTKEGLKILASHHDDIITTTKLNIVQHLNNNLATTTPAQLLKYITQTKTY